MVLTINVYNIITNKKKEDDMLKDEWQNESQMRRCLINKSITT